MAKNFQNAGSVKVFSEVAKVEKEKAQVISILNIRSEDLIDNPRNGEDISYTEDLEESIAQIGFTDPLEVTDFEMDPGKYMILAGHRRRMAGTKMGIDVFPCIVRHFKNRDEVQNYTLMSNSQRDSAKDPFLFSKRYKMHEQYLKDIGFKGSKREEIAKRLGLSIQQADRYNTMNKIILPVWDMVRAEIVGMSSVQPMATYSPDEQEEIVRMMQEALNVGKTLTRDRMKEIVSGYKNGKRTWAEIEQGDLPIPDVQVQKSDEKNIEERVEERQEEKPDLEETVAAFTASDVNKERTETGETEWESPHREEVEEKISPEVDSEMETEMPEEELESAPTEIQDQGKETAEMSKERKNGENIKKLLVKMDSAFSDVYEFENYEDARKTLLGMAQVCNMMVDEMSNISINYQMDDTFFALIKKFMDELKNYKN